MRTFSNNQMDVGWTWGGEWGEMGVGGTKKWKKCKRSLSFPSFEDLAQICQLHPAAVRCWLHWVYVRAALQTSARPLGQRYTTVITSQTIGALSSKVLQIPSRLARITHYPLCGRATSYCTWRDLHPRHDDEWSRIPSTCSAGRRSM